MTKQTKQTDRQTDRQTKLTSNQTKAGSKDKQTIKNYHFHGSSILTNNILVEKCILVHKIFKNKLTILSKKNN
jgi:hypothetical protein